MRLQRVVVMVWASEAGWLARHSTIKKMGPLTAWTQSMGTEQCAVVVSLLKLKLWLRSIQSRAEKQCR